MVEYDGIEVICECVGRCGILNVQRWEDEEEMLSLQYYIPVGYHTYVGWKQALKLIWAVIRGKQYYFFDVILNKKQTEKLKEYLSKEHVEK